MTRAERNNNPLNIRISKDIFKGEVTSPTEETEFKVFINRVWGYRAAFKILDTYKNKYGIKTIKGIIERWAPKEDGNDTEAYISRVANRTGINPYDELTNTDYPFIVEAMAKVEGIALPNRKEIQEAYIKLKIEQGL